MRKIFLALLVLGLVLILGMGVFVFYYYPHFVRPRLNYEEAVDLYARGEYVSAAMSFESMTGYSNAAEYAKRAWMEAGSKSFEAGDIAQARTYYTKAGADSSVMAALDEKYFELGKKAYQDGDHLEGESCFLCVTEGSPYLELMDPIRIAYAADCLEEDDYSTAQTVLNLCSEENYDEIAELWYSCGDGLVHIWDLPNADLCFAKALNYATDKADIESRMKELWKLASDIAAADGNLELAEKCSLRSGVAYDPELHREILVFRDAVALFNEGNFIEALPKFEELENNPEAQAYVDDIKGLYARYFVGGGSVFYATLDLEGKVQQHGDWEDYEAPDWTNIGSLAVGFYRFMLGLKANGTVVGSGNGSWGNLAVDEWHNIVQVACGDMHAVGLMDNGTVVACGRDYYGQVSHTSLWSDVIQVDAGVSFTAALMEDGTVSAYGANEYGQCDTYGMHDIVQIACGASHLVALRSDGTVMAVGRNDYGQCNVESFTGVAAVYAGAYHTVIVKNDGSIIGVGSNDYGECNLIDYRDPLCVACGANFTLLILKDGTEIKLGAVNYVG